MKSKTIFIIILLVYNLSLPVLGQQYNASSDVYRSSWATGSWKGEHTFSKVYCLTFPQPERALEKIELFYNKNAIHLTRVTYTGKLMANVVVSSMPQGRTIDAEIAKLIDVERRIEKAYKHDFNISQVASQFGPIIQSRIKDVAPAGKQAPFPLVRPIFKPAKPPIESMSIHRLFVLPPNRFEVAVFQSAPDNADANTEAEMEHRLAQLADKIVSSVNRCSKQL